MPVPEPRVKIIYLEEDYDLVDRPVKRCGPLQLAPGQGQDGYGVKITTDHMLRLRGENRLRRVYATGYGNVASRWVVIMGVKQRLR